MKFGTLITLFCLSLLACKENSQKKLQTNINQLEQNKSFASSDTLINSYLEYVKLYPTEPNAVKYLYKAAEANVKAKRNAIAANLYERVALEYPNEKEIAPEALIKAGLNYESLADINNAKRVYELFLSKFPTHERASDIRKNKELLGLSVEEMMERILPKDTSAIQ